MYVWRIMYSHGDKLKWEMLNGLNPHKVIETLQRIQYDKSKKILIHSMDVVGQINKSNGEMVTLPLMV